MTPAARPARLDLEALADRLVPSAVQLDLTSRGAVKTAPSGAVLVQTDAQPTGTGVIRSFVRVQGAASGTSVEQGYNTTARPLQFDENKSPSFTRDVTVGQVPVVTRNGVAYREFLLDVNQKASASKLSLDEARVYLADRPDLSGYDAAAKTLGGKPAAFDLDAGGDVAVVVDARLNSGSGSGDLFLLVPESAFAGATANTSVYLYSKFGGEAGAAANGGFEEWACPTGNTGVTPPPDGGSGGAPASLAGRVYADAGPLRNNAYDPGEGLQGIAITLTGVDDRGQTVTAVAYTAADGSYRFDGLRPGTYTLIEDQPLGYLDGQDFVGSLGGQASTDPSSLRDQIGAIVVGAGQAGTGYDFSELVSDGTNGGGGLGGGGGTF